jgi:hypothetical protein
MRSRSVARGKDLLEVHCDTWKVHRRNTQEFQKHAAVVMQGLKVGNTLDIPKTRSCSYAGIESKEYSGVQKHAAVVMQGLMVRFLQITSLSKKNMISVIQKWSRDARFETNNSKNK